MEHVHETFCPLLLIPGAPRPVTAQELQRLRDKAWADIAAIEASDGRYHRALRDQQQHLGSMGAL